MCAAKGYSLGSLVIWTLGNLVVGPGARLIVPTMVLKSLYLGLMRGCRESKRFGSNASVDLWISGYKLSIRLVLG